MLLVVWQSTEHFCGVAFKTLLELAASVVTVFHALVLLALCCMQTEMSVSIVIIIISSSSMWVNA